MSLSSSSQPVCSSEENGNPIKLPRHQTAALNHSLSKNDESQTASTIKSNTKKKQVNFNNDVSITAPEHVPTQDERQLMWYSREEYTKFKFDSGNDAGVRILDYLYTEPPPQDDVNAPSAPPIQKFIMMGNFDREDINAPVASGTKRSRDDMVCHVPIKCRSEYADSFDRKGDLICKRGLGYHFSHYRKKNRLFTRIAVLTLQKNFRSRDQTQQQQWAPLKLSTKCDVKLDKRSHHLLAVASFKCSRTSRQAAIWRGAMDRAVAVAANRGLFFDLGTDVIPFARNEEYIKKASLDAVQETPMKRQKRDEGDMMANKDLTAPVSAAQELQRVDTKTLPGNRSITRNVSDGLHN